MKLTMKDIGDLRELIATTAVYSDYMDEVKCYQLRGLINGITHNIEREFLETVSPPCPPPPVMPSSNISAEF